MKDKTAEILDLMMQCESASALMYKDFAAVYPRAAEFFETLAGTKSMHARMVKGLLEKLQMDSILLSPEMVWVDGAAFEIDKLSKFISHIRESGALSRSGTVTLASALSDSLNIEQNLIASKFYQAIHIKAPELATLVKLLLDDTHNHINLLLGAQKSIK